MIRNTVLSTVGALALGASEVTSTHSAEHYTSGDGCDGWYLVKNDRLNVIQERMPPGTSEERHKHLKAQQFFFVLKGQASLEIEGRTLTLHEREGALVRPGEAHRMQNASKQELEFVVTSEPPSHGDRVAAPAN